MPSQLVKCPFGFRSFNDPKTKCVPLSVELGSEQGGHVPPVPPLSRALLSYRSVRGLYFCSSYSITHSFLNNHICTIVKVEN